MRKFIIFFAVIITVFLVASFVRSFFGHPICPGTKIAHRLSREIAEKMKEKYQLRYMGLWEAAPDRKYTMIGFNFNCPRILTKDEGREILLDFTQEALNTFNSHPEFEPYMKNVPFTYRDISISIFIHPPENFDVYYPEISDFTCLGNELWYATDAPGHKGFYYTKEIETIDEAKKIIQEKAQGK